jgi:hypothetical protein
MESSSISAHESSTANSDQRLADVVQEASGPVLDKIKDIVTNLQRSLSDKGWENERSRIRSQVLKEQLTAQNEALRAENEALKEDNKALKEGNKTQRLLVKSYKAQASIWHQRWEKEGKAARAAAVKSKDVNGELKIKVAAMEGEREELLGRIEQLEMALQVEQSWNSAEMVTREGEEQENGFLEQASTVFDVMSRRSSLAFVYPIPIEADDEYESEEEEEGIGQEWQVMRSHIFSGPPSFADSSPSPQCLLEENRNDENEAQNGSDGEDHDQEDEEYHSRDEEDELWCEPSEWSSVSSDAEEEQYPAGLAIPSAHSYEGNGDVEVREWFQVWWTNSLAIMTEVHERAERSPY